MRETTFLYFSTTVVGSVRKPALSAQFCESIYSIVRFWKSVNATNPSSNQIDQSPKQNCTPQPHTILWDQTGLIYSSGSSEIINKS